MRITGDHTTALSFIGHGHGQQRGMPLIARQGETFRQSYLETVVGILGKLDGWIADRCQSLDVTHDDDDVLRVHSPVIATGQLCVCWQGSDSPTTCRSIVWDENTLAEQCRERPVPVPSGSSGFLFSGFFLLHRQSLTCALALFSLPGSFFGLMKGIGVLPLFLGETG